MRSSGAGSVIGHLARISAGTESRQIARIFSRRRAGCLARSPRRLKPWEEGGPTASQSARRIIIASEDCRRLEHLLASEFAEAIGPKAYLVDLRTELQRASIVDPEDVPGDVITMTSTVRLRDLDTDEVETYTLVYPSQADIAAKRLSILAPIGTAILGYRVGDIVRWRVPSGKRRLKIEEVLYQPEREEALHVRCKCVSLIRKEIVVQPLHKLDFTSKIISTAVDEQKDKLEENI